VPTVRTLEEQCGHRRTASAVSCLFFVCALQPLWRRHVAVQVSPLPLPTPRPSRHCHICRWAPDSLAPRTSRTSVSRLQHSYCHP